MNKHLVLLAAVSMLFSACGNSEEPKVSQPATGAQQSETAAMAPGMGESMGEAGAAMEEMPQMMAADETMAETMPESQAAPAPMMAAPQGDPAKGKQVYGSICFACHDQGVAGAPKLGDKAAWGPRIAQGMDVLVSHSITGFTGKTGTMPPKGGRMDLSDADMANCVAYMVSQAQ
ncbi:MAG TPA: c-type cytochrome [Gammaproteobacteria bacterium]|jgi:cytochrome c5